MGDEVEYRAVLAVDIEHSAGRGNVALLRIREVLAEALRESFLQSGIDWEACLRDDLGDGFRVTAPAGVRKTRLIHPLVHELAARLRAHNRTAGPSTRIRVRAALHAGDVRVGPHGEVSGRPLEVLARLLDAGPVRTALARAPEAVCVALVVSPHFYDETVPHGYPGIDPEAFREVAVKVKEHTSAAWLHLPGHPDPAPEPDPAPAPEPAPAPAPAPDPERAPDTATGERAPERPAMVNNAYEHGTVYATQNGSQNIHITGRP